MSTARPLALIIVIAALCACSPQQAPSSPTPVAPPKAAAATPAPLMIQAPAGRYAVDHNHADLSFSVKHVGMSNYIARFTDYTLTLDLVPDNIGASSVQLVLDPTSVKTDYDGDYPGTHPDSPFQTWNEALAMSERFFNAGEYPTIEFRSTQVRATGGQNLSIVGDLTLLGQTHPVTLEASIVGSSPSHPVSGKGGGMIGFSASGSFQRSQFGMDFLVKPKILGDTVTIRFEGEFQQQVDADQPA